MKEIIFNPDGERLRTVLEFSGMIAAAYTIKLSLKDSNKAVFYRNGDNLNTEDDQYDLPAPASENEGRILRLSTEFYGLDPVNFKEYNIVINVFQGDQLLGSQNDKGAVTGITQSSLQFVKLVANPKKPDV